MAITVVAGGAQGPLGNGTYTASVKALWTTIHNSLIATASNAAALANPGSTANSDTNAVLVKVPDNAVRCRIRGRCAVAISAVSTSPVVQVYGLYTDTQNIATGGTTLPADARWERLDAATLAGTGTTLTFAAASSNTQVVDATYLYTDVSSDIDCKGAQYVLVLVKTAGAGLTNGGTPTAEISFVN